MHTRQHTHTFSYSQIEFSPFQEMNLRRSAEIYLFYVVHFPHNLPFFLTQWFLLFHRMTPPTTTTPWELPQTRFSLQKQAARGSNWGKIKIAPLIQYITVDCWSLSCGKVEPSPPCLIVKHWYKICPCSLALRGWKQKKKMVFYYIFQYWTLLFLLN